MSTSRKIQIALGTILLLSSTSVSSFAATNTINPGKLQSITVKIPVESIPSRQLNLTQDSNLIAQSMGSIRQMLSQIPGVYDTFKRFDDIWKNPVDRKKRFVDYCNSQKNIPVDQCFNFIRVWVMDEMDKENVDDWDELIAIDDAVIEMRNSTTP